MQKLVNGVLVDLTPEEISQREANALTAQAEQARQLIIDEIDANKKYLSDTDYYVVRFTETGVAIPTAVSTARTEARALINTLEGQL